MFSWKFFFLYLDNTDRLYNEENVMLFYLYLCEGKANCKTKLQKDLLKTRRNGVATMNISDAFFYFFTTIAPYKGRIRHAYSYDAHVILIKSRSLLVEY